MRKLIFALAAVAVFQSTNSLAAITIYTSQSSFLAAVGASGLDTFDDLDNTRPTPSPLNRTAGPFGYTAAVPEQFYGAGSGRDHWLSTNRAADPITFSNFTGGVSAFGGQFFSSDINGLYTPGSVILTATDSSGTVTETITGSTTSSFRGFVSTGPLLSTTLRTPTGSAVWPTANNLLLAAPISAAPEPASWAMMIVGFGLVGSQLRRRKRSASADLMLA
jgi:hypothetical protein